MSTLQMDFFAKTTEDQLMLEVAKFRDEVSALRRGMFSRHGELYKSVSEMQKTLDLQSQEIEELKHILDEYVLKQ